MTTDLGPFPRANPGDPLRIPAAAYNRMRDATIKVEQGFNVGRIIGGRPSPREVLIKNATITDRSRYDVMGISDPLFGPSANLTEFQTNLCLQGISPHTDNHTGKWAVLMEPIAAGQIGRAIISGDTIALIDINSADDTHVEIATGDYRLQSGTTGTGRILWKESGTGADKWAVIRMGDSDGGPRAFIVTNVNDNDFLTCQTWDGTTAGGTNIYVAKPYLLRHGVGFYPWLTSFTTVNSQQATVVYDSTSYTWKVTLPYYVDEIIWAHRTTLEDVEFTPGTPLVWEDLNVSAHAWGVEE